MMFSIKSMLLVSAVLAPAAPPSATTSHIWSQQFGDEAAQLGCSVAVGGNGNLAFGGRFYGTIDLGGGALISNGLTDGCVAMFDLDGNHIWSRSFGDEEYQQPIIVDADSLGNLIVTGPFEGTVDFSGGPLTCIGGYDVFLAKFDPTGNHLWSRRFGGVEMQYPRAVAIDALDNIILGVSFSGEIDFGGGLMIGSLGDNLGLAKFSPDGEHIWSRSFGDKGSVRPFGVAVDGSGNIIVTGWFSGYVDFGGGPLRSNNGHIYVVKFDAGGNFIWQKQFGDSPIGTHAGYQCPSGATVDPAGNVLIAGSFSGPLDLGGGTLFGTGAYDIFIVKLDLDGHHLWSRCFGDAEIQEVNSIVSDGAGIVSMVGEMRGSIDFGGGTITSAGHLDLWIAQFEPDGTHRWSFCFGDPTYQAAKSVAADAAGDIYITGAFEGTVDFGGEPLVVNGLADTFLAKFGSDVRYAVSYTDTSGILLQQNRPNPFNPKTTISFTLPVTGHVTVTINDARGMEVARLVDEALAAGAHTVDWNGVDASGRALPSGTYFCRLTTPWGVETRKLQLIR